MFFELVAALLLIAATWLLAFYAFTLSTVQRYVLYAHKLPVWWRQDLDHPESFGFLPNQVNQYWISTKDHERLFSWIVLPINVYLQHETQLRQSGDNDNTARENVVKLIVADKNAKLVIYFHGNANTVASTRRTEAYRSISAGSARNTYVLSFDYRGFGRSTGSPTQAGLIQDARAVIGWAMNTLKIKPSNILLLSQSLGTAVASAAFYDMLDDDEPVNLAGLIACAPFTNAKDVFRNFQILGLPLLTPLKLSRTLEKWFDGKVIDTWCTDKCIQELMRRSDVINLVFLHCETDDMIPAHMTESLASIAVDAIQCKQEVTDSVSQDEYGGSVQVFGSDQQRIRKIIVKYGGHNTVMKWAPVAVEVARMLKEE